MSRLFVLEMFVCSYRLSLSLSSSSSSILLLPLLMPGEKLHPSGLLFFANVLLSFFIVFLRRSPSFRLDRNCLHSFFDRLWLSDRLWFLFHINRQNSVLHLCLGDFDCICYRKLSFKFSGRYPLMKIDSFLDRLI